jgi:beta-fructofuranosidase
VVDVNNTSGFFPNQDNGVVAMYTLAVEDGYQVQNIAYSVDNGYTFQQYEKNPVINIQSPEFRDPQVTWHSDTQRWVRVFSITLL